MNIDPIQKLLRTADEQSRTTTSDTRALADKVLRLSRRRRTIRISTVLVLLLATSIFTIDLTRRPSMPSVVSQYNKPALEGRVEVDELKQLRDRIALQEMIVKRLEEHEASVDRSVRIAALIKHPDEAQVIERAAAAIVLQADRALRETNDPAPALRAYREVVTNFPQAISAEVARQRIAQIEKAG